MKKIKNQIILFWLAVKQFIYRSGIDGCEDDEKKEIFNEQHSWFPMRYPNKVVSSEYSTVNIKRLNGKSLRYNMIDTSRTCESWADSNMNLFLTTISLMFIAVFSAVSIILPISILGKIIFVAASFGHAILALFLVERKFADELWSLILVGNISFLVILVCCLIINNVIFFSAMGGKAYFEYHRRMIKNALNK